MIVAKLVVVTSASVLTVHSQCWNCHLRIEADVNFVEVTTFAFVYNFNMGSLFCLHALESICAKIVSPRFLHQPKSKIRNDGGVYLHQVTTKSLFHLNQSYLCREIDHCGFALIIMPKDGEKNIDSGYVK
jgi:hypothetical protein